MTENAFKKKLQQMIDQAHRRITFLEKVVKGTAKGRDITVRAHKVRAYFVPQHTRFIENR
jgi:hypothetical protein